MRVGQAMVASATNSEVRDAVLQLASLLDRQADLTLRIAKAVEALADRADEIEELREEVRALSNRIGAVQRYGVETRKATRHVHHLPLS